MSVIFAILVISNSIILNNTILLFVFGIGMIIFKGLEIYLNSKELKKTK